MIEYQEIFDLNEPELFLYTGLNENQLKRYFEPEEGLFICESPKVIRRALAAGYRPVSIVFEPRHAKGEDRDILEDLPAIPAYAAPEEVLVRLTGYNLTGGMLCAMRRKPLPAVSEIVKGASRIAVLEDIENPTNVGAIFRSAAALNIDAVILTKGCSDPLYRRSARVSVGTVFQIPWTFAEEDYLEELKKAGFRIASMALSDNSIGIADPALKYADKLALILGNEESGVTSKTLSASDFIVKIPMREGVDSLNVAAASAVAFWELKRLSE